MQAARELWESWPADAVAADQEHGAFLTAASTRFEYKGLNFDIPWSSRRAWTDDDRALVEDRIATQFAGSPATVTKNLRVLRDATSGSSDSGWITSASRTIRTSAISPTPGRCWR